MLPIEVVRTVAVARQHPLGRVRELQNVVVCPLPNSEGLSRFAIPKGKTLCYKHVDRHADFTETWRVDSFWEDL